LSSSEKAELSLITAWFIPPQLWSLSVNYVMISLVGQGFLHVCRLALESTQLPIQWMLGHSQGKAAGA